MARHHDTPRPGGQMRYLYRLPGNAPIKDFPLVGVCACRDDQGCFDWLRYKMGTKKLPVGTEIGILWPPQPSAN